MRYVIDQSPVPGKSQPLSAVALSARLARACDRAGYSRYWVAEHHNSINFAGPSPEILISHIATITEHLRVGSGGVMLPHYSPYKVAEQFKVLESLFPGRIDLGIGRAPGGDGLASHALAYPYAPAREDHYARQAALLKGFLTRSIPGHHPYHALQVMPDERPCPEAAPAANDHGHGGHSQRGRCCYGRFARFREGLRALEKPRTQKALPRGEPIR